MNNAEEYEATKKENRMLREEVRGLHSLIDDIKDIHIGYVKRYDIAQTEVVYLQKELAKLEAEVIAMRYQMPQWIAVDDWLPEEGQSILGYIFAPAFYIEIDVFYFQDGVFGNKSAEGYDVTHWMPLPDAPKEGE